MGTVSHNMQLAQQQLLQSNTKQLEPHKGKVTSYLMVPMQKSFLSFTYTSVVDVSKGRMKSQRV